MATSCNNLNPNLISEVVGEDVLHDNNGDVERPIGRKAEKAKRKRIERPSEDVMVFMKKKTKILEETCVQGEEFINLERKKLRLDQLDQEHRHCIEEEKLNIEKKKFQLQELDREDKLLKWEEEIMLIDTSGMSMVQRINANWKSLKSENQAASHQFLKKLCL
ncbi:hypothetical protein FH972_020014 [Carpinus fangiana]|uniref:No apical meristem-associated C-terminal domain-containing protein n=1 Tax=Carpinus fangiana TaxID=176857 RepID=A0A5N6RV42_9ROSI|nr:hypothetical protein FH972_020014 [Carpinus fangiana]